MLANDMEMTMRNAVPLVTIANTYNVSIQELLCLVAALKLDLVHLANTPFVCATDFEFLSTADEIFLNTSPAEHAPELSQAE